MSGTVVYTREDRNPLRDDPCRYNTRHGTLDAHAREWLGVPWRHLGRTRGGVDCIGLILLAAAAAGIHVPDPAPYKRDPDGTKLVTGILTYADRAPLAPGAVLLFRAGMLSGHVGVASIHPTLNVPSVIHAFLPHKKVVENTMAEFLRAELVGAYRLRT